jgi:hypothetical protein
MTEHELDQLLAEAKKQATAPAAAISRLVAAEVVEQATAKPASRRRWLRKGILIPVGIGAVALSGAGTYGAYQLSIPPFVETEPGVERVVDPIALTYTTDAGTVLDCKLYLEFTDVTEAQREALNSLSTNSLWRDFGQKVYEGLPAKSRAIQDGPEPVWSERVSERVYDEGIESAPGLQFQAAEGTPSIHGSTTRCEYPEGQR